ncbi:uncharacterized protein [Haliotis cracherodii]|uniref:uncharacterized protein n=1 Tax=Haliotis cracherodii TaxID=6455 RepID=UPI0039EC4FA1
MASNCLQAKNVSCADEEGEFVKNIPVVIMFSLFAAVGVFGNILILYIYGLKFKESTTRVFILSLAVFDLISCVSLPYKITLLRYGSLFSNPNLARLDIVRIYFLQVSVSILPLMSFDRYRRICEPFKLQMSPKMAKILVTCVIVIMTIFTIVRMVVTSYTSNQCYRAEAFVSAEFVNKTVQVWLQELNFICVILPFILPLPILIAVYILIGVKVRRLSKNSKRGVEGLQDTTLTRFTHNSTTDKQVVAKDDVDGGPTSALHPSGLYRSSDEGLDKGLQSDMGRQSETRDHVGHSDTSPDKQGTSHHRTIGNAYSTQVAIESGSSGQTRPRCEQLESSKVEVDTMQRNKRFNKVYPHNVRIPRVWGKKAPKVNTSTQGAESKSGEELASSSKRLPNQPMSATTVKRQTNVELHVENSMSSFSPEQDMFYKGTPLDKPDDGEDQHESKYTCSPAENPHQQEGVLKDLTPCKHSEADKRLPWKRMTLIFFLITVVYIVSCLPFFTIYIIFRVAPCYGYGLLSQGGYIVLYNFVYITIVSNCFLYGFFDPRFKKQLRCVKTSILHRLC